MDGVSILLIALGPAVATSIDALAVGVSFAFLEVSIVYSVAVIGAVAVALVLSIIGVYIGGGFAGLFERRIGIFGGVVLIGIGL